MFYFNLNTHQKNNFPTSHIQKWDHHQVHGLKAMSYWHLNLLLLVNGTMPV